MSEEIVRRLVEEHWDALEAEPTTGERRLRVSHLPIVVENGNRLAVGVDHDGYRHVLVPMAAHRRVRAGLDGPVLQLRRRPLEDDETYQTYADLSCLRSDLNDLFTDLCVDVMSTAQRLPENPLKALHHVLDRWKELFRSQGAPLTREQMAGLFGELTLLCRLFQHNTSAHRLWIGPTGHRHDFSSGVTAIEVKSGTSTSGRRPRIHGLDQLESPEGGTLALVWFRLLNVPAGGPGLSLVDLVDQARRLCDDEGSLLDLLAAAGYRPSDIDHYRDVRFAVGEETWYHVSADFPGLTSRRLGEAGLSVSVLDVEYTIDLSGDVPTAMPEDEVSRLIDDFVQEPR
ncbi:PD-(D/E)XK motif protein [Streptomyces sp. NBC_00572]|uniref:PD-(D/E)XK motif protein n=1 Tax=Streptomyces sp. NBC_00572 TaxID=2903664 RepID=UPI0022569939|nr:PD-(D/E)XK motif protein [Streptomyces sp. NBC_00572]MCX4981106.1 PD-(D/E)XK motif protein [Streptomyces sp. NBC_00572]